MNRRIGILLAIYIGIILLFAYIRPSETDWSPSFSPEKTMPFAAQVLFNELSVVRDELLEKSERPIYNFVKEHPDERNTIYFFLNPSFRPGELDLKSLLEFISAGNTAFIASEDLSEELLDTLGISQEYAYVGTDNFSEWFYEDNITLAFAYDSSVTWPAAVSSGYAWYTLEDSSQVVGSYSIIGVFNDEHPNFVRCTFGDGEIFLHAFPYAFSNYHMLYQENHRYISEALAHVPKGTKWYWDTYYLSARAQAGTPFAALNRYETFRWAYWLAIIGVIIFIFFTAKRRQRMIPVVEPKRNTTLDFVHTIGDLYFYRADSADLMKKKVTILQAQIQKKYRVPITEFSESEAQELASRAGHELSLVQSLFAQIRQLNVSEEMHTSSLFALQHQLDAFLRRQRTSPQDLET